MQPAGSRRDAAFKQGERSLEVAAYLARNWRFESISLQRGVMQTIGSALGDELSVTEIRDGLSKRLSRQRSIGDALRYLGMTMEGKQWTATLYSHIFAIEHNRQHMGPQAGLSPKEG